MNRSKRANHFGTICEKRMAKKRRFALERSSWHDARFGNGTPVEIKSPMLEHSDGQPGNFKVYCKYHEKLRRADGWYCFVVYRPHGRSGCTIVRDKMVRSVDLPLLQWHGGGDHRGTAQAKISISDVLWSIDQQELRAVIPLNEDLVLRIPTYELHDRLRLQQIMLKQ